MTVRCCELGLLTGERTTTTTQFLHSSRSILLTTCLHLDVMRNRRRCTFTSHTHSRNGGRQDKDTKRRWSILPNMVFGVFVAYAAGLEMPESTALVLHVCVIIAKNWILLLYGRIPSAPSLRWVRLFLHTFCLFRADVAVWNVYIFYSRFILLRRRRLHLRCWL